LNDIIDRIALLIKARYPLMQLVTHEEQRIERALDKMASKESLPVWKWTLTHGLRGPNGPVADTNDAAQALAALGALRDPGLFVFFDLHPFLNDPSVVRSLRDLARTTGARRQATVLVGESARIPPELEKQIVLIDAPLPDRDAVARILAVLLKSQSLKVPNERFERFVRGSLGLTEAEIKRLYARILIGGGRFDDDDLKSLVLEKKQAIRRNRYLEFWEAGGSVGDVGGMDNLKTWLDQRRLGFTARAQQFGLPEPRGVFLLGVQGCGKSLMAKAVADLWQLPLLRLDVAAVFQSSNDEEQSLRHTVRIAESLAPAVLWIDEIEKGFGKGQGASGDAFGTFLTWMQEKTRPVFVVATANEVRALPPELLRKGRFDEIFFVDLPNVHERLTILEIHLRRRNRNADAYDLTQVTEESERFSGAELEQVVVQALFNAFSAGRELEEADLLDAAREMIPLAVTMDDHLKDLREWARPRARRASMERRRIDFFKEWEEVS
jgi:SpoVK/Ycf46/Vps4 family AAA+-type ATPase